MKGECLKSHRLIPKYTWNNFSFEIRHHRPILPGTATWLCTCLFPSPLEFLKDNVMKQVGLTTSEAYGASRDTRLQACCKGLPTAITLQHVTMLARDVSASGNICLSLAFVRYLEKTVSSSSFYVFSSRLLFCIVSKQSKAIWLACSCQYIMLRLL